MLKEIYEQPRAIRETVGAKLDNGSMEIEGLNLTKEYLKEKYSTKKLPIKTVILDQSIITGIGNIYDDEYYL